MEPQEVKPPSNFEEGMRRLEEIVRRLEEGEIPLEEHLELVREGLFLVRWCEERLRDAERKIQKVVEEGEGIRFEVFEVQGDEQNT